MTTDVSGGGITSQVANDQVGRCPYSKQVCALTLGDSFFCSLFPGHRSSFFVLFFA